MEYKKWTKAKVWNDHSIPYKEYFQGEDICIKPKEFIIMPRDKAIAFQGSYNTPIRSSENGMAVASFKMIRLEPLFDTKNEDIKEYRCPLDSTNFNSQEDLDRHTLEKHHDKIEDKKLVVKLKDKLG